MMIAAACATDSPSGPTEKAAVLQALSPTVLTGIVGTAVEPSPTVIAKDAAGKPVAGVPVQFVVESGGGSVSAPFVLTDGAGVATVSWILGTSVDLQFAHDQLLARVVGVGGIRFTAASRAGKPARLQKLFTPGDSLVSGFVSEISTRVTDRYGNPIADVPVTFTITRGGGQVDQGLGPVPTASASTNFAGEAQISWLLGDPGENTVTASVEGVDDLIFSVAALDPANFTWYDLEVIDGVMQGIAKSYVGLDSNGHFAWQTIWNGGFSESEFGHYEITESRIVLIGSSRTNGVIDSDVLVLQVPDDWDGLLNTWYYRKRKITA
jgi:hypothetical protein